jgi:hypothetical protein
VAEQEIANFRERKRKNHRPSSRALDMAFVPFSRKMVRTAASSEPAAQAESLPFMSLVDASSKQHEDGEPEQMMRQLSIRDQEQGEDFNQNNVQQVLEHNIALRRNFDDVRVILLAAFPYASTYLAFLELQHGQGNFVHHRNANGYYACSCSSRYTSIGFDFPWKNFPVSTESLTISSPGRDSERSFVCLFVCLCLECGS